VRLRYDVPSKFALAIKNIPKCAAVSVAELSVYEMLLRHRVVLTASAVEVLEDQLGAWVDEKRPVNAPPRIEELADGDDGSRDETPITGAAGAVSA
jgi:hypothetical protein